MHPVMFGEYVPLGDRFPWLQKLTPLGDNLERRAKARPSFTLGKLRIAPTSAMKPSCRTSSAARSTTLAEPGPGARTCW